MIASEKTVQNFYKFSEAMQMTTKFHNFQCFWCFSTVFAVEFFSEDALNQNQNTLGNPRDNYVVTVAPRQLEQYRTCKNTNKQV